MAESESVPVSAKVRRMTRRMHRAAVACSNLESEDVTALRHVHRGTDAKASASRVIVGLPFSLGSAKDDSPGTSTSSAKTAPFRTVVRPTATSNPAESNGEQSS